MITYWRNLSSLLFVLLALPLLAAAQSVPRPSAGPALPRSVIAYDTLRLLNYPLPVMHIHGKPLEIRTLCRVLARAAKEPGPFVTQPEDFVEDATCDTSRVELAFGGHCDSGFRNAKHGVQLKLSHWPCARLECYDSGWCALFLNNIRRCDVIPTEADEQVAAEWLQRVFYAGVPAGLTVWGQGSLFPAEWQRGNFPPMPPKPGQGGK